MAATTTSMSDKTVFWLPKIMYFLLFSAFGAVNSFLPVFYFDVKHLTLSQIGTLGLLIPLSKFLASPLYSAIADRFSAHRAVLLFAIVACVSLRSSLLLIDGFAAILVTAMAAESIGSVISPIFENGVLHILPDKNMYGRNRLFGAAGYGTAVLCSGLAIYHAHAPWPMFLISALLYASVAVLSFRLQLTFKDEGKEQPSVEYREISKRSAIFRAMTTDTYAFHLLFYFLK